jgi:hypothetical protein
VKYPWLLAALLPLLPACAQTHAVRFPLCAFPTKPEQKVVLKTLRGRTEVRGVQDSRDIMVSGTIHTTAGSLTQAEAQAQAVRVVNLSLPEEVDPVLRLEVVGIPAGSATRFDAEFWVPKDVKLEIIDGPEDLFIEGVEAGVAIEDGPGDIELRRIKGPVAIRDQDGNISYYGGRGPVFIADRRGDITIEEVAGDLDITDREDDVLIQSVTGKLTYAKDGRGTVRINNLDGPTIIREWVNNPGQPILNTIWRPTAEPRPSSDPARGASSPSPALREHTPGEERGGESGPAGGPDR